MPTDLQFSRCVLFIGTVVKHGGRDMHYGKIKRANTSNDASIGRSMTFVEPRTLTSNRDRSATAVRPGRSIVYPSVGDGEPQALWAQQLYQRAAVRRMGWLRLKLVRDGETYAVLEEICISGSSINYYKRAKLSFVNDCRLPIDMTLTDKKPVSIKENPGKYSLDDANDLYYTYFGRHQIMSKIWRISNDGCESKTKETPRRIMRIDLRCCHPF